MNESPGVAEQVESPVPAHDAAPSSLPAGPSASSEATDRQRRRLFAAIGLFVFSAVVAVLAHWWHGYIDLQVYRNGARVWLDGGDLYGPMPPVMGLGLPFTYPPLAAAFFVPLALMPLAVAEVVVLVTSLLSLAVALWVVLVRIRPELDRISVLTVVIAGVGLAQFLEPVRQTVNFGQINLILMAAITVDVLVRKPFWPRGMLIGIAVSIKLIPAAYLLYFLLRRDWKAAGTMVVSAAGAVGVGFLLFPSDSVQYWFHTVTDTGRIGTPYFAGNQSIKGTLFRLGLDESVATGLWLLLSALTVALAAVWMYRLIGAGRDVSALLVNAAAVLLVSPVSWSHHWVWVAPALVVAVDQATRRRSRGFTTVVGVFTVLFIIGPQWVLPHSGGKELAWAWWQQIIGSTYVWATFAVIVYAVITYRPEREPAA
ncbi:membrane protein [Nocardia neocaledoniensis NBRC 108232]|uniref:Alpha-1,2-mannosyltransferase n=1 Tax=Nocardia neocaledoniensis TaxID=236511 RepID=A0A317NSR2_9NOCA|nr:glycosyltransferase 87 family protein [Nocardia neocaledoniensis]PWV78017.1 alpha-1,2-mannosyltransferase [Nocardia neocaledoniensis]GEM29785.1 membrane protein [Nocardia neocaledoniensis NBRC 108232]